MRVLNNHEVRLTAATVLALLLGSYLFSSHAEAASDTRDISRTNGRIEVSTDERVGNVSSVNGSIHIAAGAQANRVRTVNGSIHLDDNASIQRGETVNGGIDVANAAEVNGTLSTVNGGIRLHSDVTVNGSVTAVNGSIRLDRGTRVSGELRNVNGPVRLSQSEVGEHLVTSNGDIRLEEGTVVYGDVIYRSRRSWFNRLFNFQDDPELHIDAESSVKGDIHLYREVNLHIHPNAEVGEIIRHY